MNNIEREPNSLTAEEKQSLEIDRANARTRMIEVWTTLRKAEKIYLDYSRIYNTWRRRFKEADLALAMNRRTILEPAYYSAKSKGFNEWKTKKKHKLTRDDLLMLLAEVEAEEEKAEDNSNLDEVIRYLN